MNIRVETEETTGNKNKIITYAKTEPKAKENRPTLADRQQHEFKKNQYGQKQAFRGIQK